MHVLGTQIDKIHNKIDHTNRKLKWPIVKRVMAIGWSSAEIKYTLCNRKCPKKNYSGINK